MPRVQITEELANTIRTIRTENRIKASDLSSYIKKSPAYVTKLEKAELKTIEEDTLAAIFAFITNSDTDSETLSNVYPRLRVMYSPEEIQKFAWYFNFENLRCQIPVPEALINDLNQTIRDLGISRQYLLGRINANEFLPPEEAKRCGSSVNHWFISKTSFRQSQWIIKIQMSEEMLNDILDMRKDACAYTFVSCIALYLLKIKKYGADISIGLDESEELIQKAKEWLGRYHFYTVSDKARRLASAKDSDEYQSYLTAYDIDNQNVIREILDGFSYATKCNIKIANLQLSKFLENMKWDLGFMLTLISLDFSSLNKISHGNKKEILDRLKQAIEDYKKISVEKNIEIY